MSAITASRRKDLSDGFYLYKNIYLIGLRSKAWDAKSPMLSTTHAIFHGLQEDLCQLLTELPDSSPLYLKNSLIKAH